jgi:hypothetical protein
MIASFFRGLEAAGCSGSPGGAVGCGLIDQLRMKVESRLGRYRTSFRWGVSILF